MAGKKIIKLPHSDDIWYSVILGIAEYESELRNQQLKIANPIWRMKN